MRPLSSPPRPVGGVEPADGVALSYLPATDRVERDRYYGQALQASNGSELFDNLHKLLSQSHTFSMDYSSTLKVAPFLNLYPDATMHCVYTGVHFAPPTAQMPEYIARLAQDDPAWNERWGQVSALAALAPEALAAGTAVLQSKFLPKHDGGLKEIEPYGLEHLVPQSWFERMRPMRTDLHILSPVENSANSARGNLPLNDLPNAPEVAGGKSDLAAFDPQQGKGEAARATLYFLLRHPGLVGDRPGEYRSGDLKRLLDWHQKYPVTDFERHRNAAIQRLQGNRNPLVDFPQLATQIDFSLGLARPK